MPEIVLSEEQTRVVRQAAEPVTVRGSDGRRVEELDPAFAALIAKALERLERRKTDPRPDIPSEEFHAGLAALQAEWNRLGGFDAAYARDFLKRFRGGHQ